MGLIRTNWDRNLMRAFEKTAVIYQMYGSVQDTFDTSAGFNGRKMIDWLGFSCSARFIHYGIHPTVDQGESSPFYMQPTIFANSTAGTIFIGFELCYFTAATGMTAYAEALTMHFDWQMIVMSV